MLQMSFAGTLGRDPETRQAGKSEVTEFSVAVNGYDFSARAKTTTWLKVNVWGERGAKLAGILHKGDKVAGCGQFAVESYTNRDGVEKVTYKVTCQDVTLMGRPQGDAPAKASKPKQAAEFPDDAGDDDLPF